VVCARCCFVDSSSEAPHVSIVFQRFNRWVALLRARAPAVQGGAGRLVMR
jgi:hypothetical protein